MSATRAARSRCIHAVLRQLQATTRPSLRGEPRYWQPEKSDDNKKTRWNDDQNKHGQPARRRSASLAERRLVEAGQWRRFARRRGLRATAAGCRQRPRAAARRWQRGCNALRASPLSTVWFLPNRCRVLCESENWSGIFHVRAHRSRRQQFAKVSDDES